MKKNILGLSFAVMIFLSSGRIRANDTSYSSMFEMASTLAGGLPALYAIFSHVKNLYFNYIHPDVQDIHNMSAGASFIYSLFIGSSKKLSSLGKVSSLDDQFMKAATQLFERLTDQEASIKDAIDLLQTLITKQPQEIFDRYKTRLGMVADAEIRTKIDYYLGRILEKMKLHFRINPSREEEIGLKQALLDMIYRELYDRDRELPILKELEKELEKMLDELEKQWQEEMLPGSKLAIKKEEKTITFDKYIDVPKEARDFVNQIKDPKINESFGIPLPGGILLTGDPGTGKTYLARAIAGELDCPFFVYTATDLVGYSYSPAIIRYVFRVAREEAEKEHKKMAIIFIDEFDAIGSRTAENVNIKTTQSVNSLLTQLEGFEQKKVKVIVIAATNHPDRIDPALLRSGRIETIVRIGYPNKEARKDLLKEFIGDKRVNNGVASGFFIMRLADVTNGLSPADIRLFVENASRIAIIQNKAQTGIDYECVARALWDMKKAKYKKQVPNRSEKEALINNLLTRYPLNIEAGFILTHIEDMSKSDSMQVLEKLAEVAERNYSKELLEKYFTRTINIIKIQQKRDLINLCEEVYDPIKIDEYNYPKNFEEFSEQQRKDIFSMQFEDIFKKFEEAYRQVEDIFKESEKSYQQSIGKSVAENKEPEKEEKPIKIVDTQEKK